MRLTIVGSSGSMSGPASAASCYLVQASDGARTWNILLDLGSGAFGALMRHLDPALVDAVVLSHLHADHVVDITGLEVFLRYHPGGALPPVRVLGPVDAPGRIAGLTMDSVESLARSFVFDTLEEGRAYDVGPLRIEPSEVNHPIEAFGLRITGPSEATDGDVTLGYSGDTDSCDGLVRLADDVDLMLCEAAFQEGRDAVRGIHLTGRRAGEAARAAGAKRLVLTHLPPWTEADTVRAEAAETYPGLIEIADPGATWVF